MADNTVNVLTLAHAIPDPKTLYFDLPVVVGEHPPTLWTLLCATDISDSDVFVTRLRFMLLCVF